MFCHRRRWTTSSRVKQPTDRRAVRSSPVGLLQSINRTLSILAGRQSCKHRTRRRQTRSTTAYDISKSIGRSAVCLLAWWVLATPSRARGLFPVHRYVLYAQPSASVMTIVTGWDVERYPLREWFWRSHVTTATAVVFHLHDRWQSRKYYGPNNHFTFTTIIW